MPEHAADAKRARPPKVATTHSAAAALTKASKRRRSALACLSCRRRKVRCNVYEQQPCTNCRFDQIICSVSPSQSHLRLESCRYNDGTRRAGEDHTDRFLPVHHVQNKDNDQRSSQKDKSDDGIDFAGSPVSDAAFSILRPWSTIDDITPMMQSLHGPVQVQPDQQSILGRVDVFNDYNRTSSSSAVATPEDTTSSGMGVSCLARPLLSRISAEDAEFLSLKGALQVPDGPFCDALLKAFINYVYPFLPIIDLATFLPLMQSHQKEATSGENCSIENTDSASLLLVQAVVFSASAFVEGHFLREAGFQSRRVARRFFYEKAKLLYTLDCESNPMAISQSLLLMTHWHETVDDEKGAPHWISLALDIAETTDDRDMTIPKQRMWKRIKWACLARDRSVALGMRNALRIDHASFKIPPLTLADLDIITTPEVTDLPFAQNTILRDAVAQVELARIFITACQLWAHIGRVLSTEYDVQSQRQPQEDNTIGRMLLCPRISRDLEAIDILDQELVHYQQSLPHLKPSLNAVDFDYHQISESVVQLHRYLVNLIYQTAIATLHRPNSNMATAEDSPTTQCSIALSKLRVSDACRSIGSMLADLYRLRLDAFLPGGALTVLIPAILTLALEWKSTSAKRAREETMRRVCFCYLVLERLRQTYCGGDHGVRLLRAALGTDFPEMERRAIGNLDNWRASIQAQETSIEDHWLKCASPISMSLLGPLENDMPDPTLLDEMFSKAPSV